MTGSNGHTTGATGRVPPALVGVADPVHHPAPATAGQARVMLQRATHALRRFTAQHAPRPGRVSLRELEQLYRSEPLLRRGIRKHSGDVVKQWHQLTLPGEQEPSRLDDLWQEWARTAHVKQAIVQALLSAHVYGDGLLELEFDDGAASTQPVSESARLVGVHVIDPVHCAFIPVREPDGRLRYVLEQSVPGMTPVRLHPDRYHHVTHERLPGSVHGQSTVEAAYYAAKSKIMADQGVGEILYHAGVPLRLWTIRDGTPDDVEAVTEAVNDPRFQRGLVWTDDLTGEQFNPTGVKPREYYDALAESIAAAIGIPKMMLLGAQAGTLSGSEVNLEDYHSDLMEVQSNQLTPLVERLVTSHLGVDTSEFDVHWLPFPTREETASQAVRDRVLAWQVLTAGGVDPVAAARVARLDQREDDLMPRESGVLPPGGGSVRAQREAGPTEGGS